MQPISQANIVDIFKLMNYHLQQQFTIMLTSLEVGCKYKIQRKADMY